MIYSLRRHKGGFTILETIIVLTVSIALLSSALLVFNGKIPRVQFDSAVNELNTKIVDTANHVGSGYYAKTSNISCKSSGELEDNTNSPEQGANANCIYLGQAIQFGVDPGSSGTCSSAGSNNQNCDKAIIYTVAGARSTNSGPSTNLTSAKPNISSTIANEPYVFGYGLHVTKIFYTDSTANTQNIGGLAFLQTFGTTTDGPNQVSGASQVQIVPLNGTAIGNTATIFADTANNPSSPGLLTLANPQSGITICLKSGTSNQWATILLARNGAVFDTQRQIYSTEPAECS